MKDINLERSVKRELDFKIRSNHPLIWINTKEEPRTLKCITDIADHENRKWDVVFWDIATKPYSLKGYPIDSEMPNNILDQIGILEFFDTVKPQSDKYLLLVLKDYDKYLNYNSVDGNIQQVEAQINRMLKNFYYANKLTKRSIIILSSHSTIPDELQSLFSIIDYPLPEYSNIKNQIEDKISHMKSSKALISSNFKVDYNDAEKEELVKSVQGLTMDEIDNLLNYSVLYGQDTNKKIDVNILSKQKQDVIKRSGILEWIDTNETMDKIGGMHGLKSWLNIRKNAFTPQAREYGLPHPNGVLLVGVSGCGKSLFCKAIAHHWGLPLLRLDLGKVFGGIVGKSESNMRYVIQVAENVSPCVLMIDEIEKALSGWASSNHTDGGISSRVFGTLLTWMQEKTSPTYLVATANNIASLPPEILRKGRFDEIFFVDLPNDEDRREIVKIHLAKKNRSYEKFNISELVEASCNYTGAEIESCIIDAMYKGFHHNREFNTQDVVSSLKEITPISKTMEEEITNLRKWATTRARYASSDVSYAIKKDNDVVEVDMEL